MANKRLRGNTWHYIVRRKNLLPKPINLTFKNEIEGDAYVAHLERLLDSGIVPDEFKSNKEVIGNIANAIDAYSKIVHVPNSDLRVLKVVRERVGNQKLTFVNYAWAEHYVQGMKTMNLSPSTIRHHVGALARCLDWIENRGGTSLLGNPLRRLPKRYASGHKAELLRERRLSIEEEQEITRILRGGKPIGRERGFESKHLPSLLLMFQLALETGMRMAEIHTLTISQVDIRNKTIFLEKTKNGDTRQVPLSTTIIKALNNYEPDSLWGGDLFPWASEKTPRRTPSQVSIARSEQFSRIFDAAGCPDFTFHGLRHEATSRLYERTTLSDIQIAKIMGWKSLKMALRYTNLRACNLAKEMW
ncbi:MAG: integrase [Methylotenera sp.]|nr:MAG: integrase [Methylotenera sp.]